MENKTDASYHVHEIMALLEKTPMSESALRAYMKEQAQGEPVFHSCSFSDMSFEQMLTFLSERDKIFEKDGVLHFTGNHCSH